MSLSTRDDFKEKNNYMNISIITRHNIINYGSVLQALALQKILENEGHKAEIIDYIREDEDYRTIAKVLVSRNKKWNSNIFTRMLFVAGKSFEFYFGGKKFEAIRNTYLNLTNKRYASLKELIAEPPMADLYMTGSDQVWGEIGQNAYDPVFFLDFAPQDVRKVSYAASLGRTDFSNEVLSTYKKLLSSYSVITVREKSAQQIIANLGYPETKQVLDPTLLLSAEQWDNIVATEKSRFAETNQKYILVYQRRPNREIDEYADKLSKKTGLPVYRLSADFHQLLRGGKLILLPNLHEFIDYLKHATFLITDSFHGTAFAINYNVQFVDVLPKGTATRNLSILELTNLSDRVVKDFSDLSCINQKIDFSAANEIICAERERSLQVLRDMIQGATK